MYYPDGIKIKISDLIWWNEGICVGFVQEIIKTKQDLETWGLITPSLAVSNLHPFNLNNPLTIVDESDIAGEGIGLLTKNEIQIFEKILTQAKSKVSKETKKLHFFVTVKYDPQQDLQKWLILFVNDDYETVESIEIEVVPGK